MDLEVEVIEYEGKTFNIKCTTKTPDGKKEVVVDDWVTFEGTHEQLVSAVTEHFTNRGGKLVAATTT